MHSTGKAGLNLHDTQGKGMMPLTHQHRNWQQRAFRLLPLNATPPAGAIIRR
eukprot:NODE_1537_length_1382_cov_7.688672_g1278_i0.p6 GENE.NODE_1537_length_1382_cov_7.688672_g1278_i0~~NODE_1537_length_1382_cov_7.688672_g1278_i0.p6  ORF type:complete len:52 (+),score=2.15 NODE_1537_length_1382_cov_7.688672_g1278_i0:623-778(+)